MNTLTPTPLLCYDCNRQIKVKLEVENKTNSILCMISKFIWWKIKTYGNRKRILLCLYNLNDFLLCHFFVCVSLFCLFFGNILQVKSFFPCFVFHINSYTFVLYLCMKMWHITFWFFSYHLMSLSTEAKNKDNSYHLCH